MPATDGLFSVSTAYEATQKKETKVNWYSFLWKSMLHPSVQGIGWKVLRGVMHTDDKLKAGKFILATICCMCKQYEEIQEHILFDCSFAQKHWEYLKQSFYIQGTIHSRNDVLNACKKRIPLTRDISLQQPSRA
ncbi:hypothetical protein IFM89_026769 [Coptis chinensis]|uniref:Reverse transcriptase zinc-binding domain-containing protein n=1 Tax=Coptis chinensis TaxID=261450 RepID=A0A835M9Q5_9MAGN|nr:hypothetical protein IFM89_026769 [Coptis chinensis]